ncbi:MAG: hypothetical protein GX661_05980 [Acholeplasmataceae bacterium]|nr:hypothetical protein [Acholeplasmataceae bacterium]
MKKLLIFLLIILGGFMVGCNDDLQVPSNFTISGSLASWDEVPGASYRLEFTNTETNQIARRIVNTNSVDLNTFKLPEGDYMVKVQSMKGDKASAFTEEVSYHQDDLSAVSEISDITLTNGVYIKWMGRTYYNPETEMNMIYHSASGFEVQFEGTSVQATLTATNHSDPNHRPYVVIVVDDDFENSRRIALDKSTQDLILAEDLEEGEHKVTLYKSTESIDSHIGVVRVSTDGKFLPEVDYKARKIEVIAASSSTGFGNLGTSSQSKSTINSDALQAYAFLAANALNADINIVAASGWGCKFSRWTNPMTKNMFDAYKKVDVESQIDWEPSAYVPDVVIINLGTNDESYISYMAQNQQQRYALMQEFAEQYLALIDYVHGLYPDAKILILYGLMRESKIYDQTIAIYNAAKEEIDNVYLLKSEGDQAGCSAHPSAASHAQIAQSVINKIKEITGWE